MLSNRLLLLVFAAAMIALGQTGSIQGSLLDATGSAVPNAKVAAVD